MVLHEPVLPAETVEQLAPAGRGLILDCTVGTGGHTDAVCRAGATRVLGLDRDSEVLPVARKRLTPWLDRVELIHSDYRDLDAVLDARGIETIDGALADLGHSTFQMESEGRGFSFGRADPLDMRMDRSQGTMLGNLLDGVTPEALADVIYQYGEERHSRRIARSIVRARDDGTLTTTADLAAAVRRSVHYRGRFRIDPATRTFQALRIWVNRELDELDVFLKLVMKRLTAGARMVVISFHSLEDRVVKHTLRDLEKSGAPVRVLTRKPLRPGVDEVARNPRARSARLRAAEKVA